MKLRNKQTGEIIDSELNVQKVMDVFLDYDLLADLYKDWEDVEDTDVTNINRRINPINDGWICPYCGKRVYSMEVHSCNQPYC